MRERVSWGSLQNILTEQWAKALGGWQEPATTARQGSPLGVPLGWLCMEGRVCQRSKARTFIFFLSHCLSLSLLAHPSSCLLAASMYVCFLSFPVYPLFPSDSLFCLCLIVSFPVSHHLPSFPCLPDLSLPAFLYLSFSLLPTSNYLPVFLLPLFFLLFLS